MTHCTRGTFLALLCASALPLLGGCKTAPSNDQPTTVTIWHVYGAQTDSPLNDLIDEFNATVGREEGVRVEVTMVSNNNNIHKDILAAANGEPGAPQLPDIFVAYPKTVLAMPDESVLVDYRDHLGQGKLDTFVPAFLEDGTANGRLVSLPVAKSTELLFVNKTAFDRFAAATGARLEDLQTWEGLWEIACAYTAWANKQDFASKHGEQTFFVHDFHFNYFQVGVESLGERFFEGEKIAFGPSFEYAWRPYAKAAISGALWLQGGYATEPLRTGETIAAVASSASVLYFSNEVIYADNTSETIEIVALPCPVFEDGERLVMQRGAGMCTVDSTPERVQAALRFLSWLTEPEHNTEFAVATGYMPVTAEAFEGRLEQAIGSLAEQMYVEVYRAFLETQREYAFYTAPQFGSYLATETAFEDAVRRHLLAAHKAYVEAGGDDPRLLDRLVEDALAELREAIGG